METIKMVHLEAQVERLNQANGFDKPKWNTIGSYHLSGAYGGWQLQQIMNKGGGVKAITSGFVTKREMYGNLNAILNTIK